MRGERVELAAPLESDAEPETTANPHSVDDYADVSLTEVPSSSTDLPTTTRPTRTHPALTANSYIDWMIERCARRRDGTEDHNRRRLYEERVTILHGLKAALSCDVEGFTVGARRTLANMSDLSDDENSPSYRDISRPTSLSDAQLAYNFVRSLQAGTEAHTGFSTNVDMVANALGRGHAWPPENLDMTSDQSSDEHMETRSEVKQRYMASSQSEVSDPDLWVLLHYGENSESESRTND